MSNKASKMFGSLKKEPKGKSIVGAIEKCLKQLDEQDGALLMHLWVGHHMNWLDSAFSRFSMDMYGYMSNSWDKNEEDFDEQALKYFEDFAERFKDLFRVMKFIEKKYPQLLEMQNLEEGDSNKKIFVQYLSFRESTLFSTSHFSMANLYKQIADGFSSWDFRSTLELWASNDVYIDQKEQDVLLEAAFGVDKKANLNCIKKWWKPEEELACDMAPTVRFAVHSKYTEQYVKIIRKDDVDRKTEAAFYNYAMWHGCVGHLSGAENFKNSSFKYILENTFAQDEEKSSLVDDYGVITRHIQKNKGVQFAESQKTEVVKKLLFAAAKEKHSELLENTFEILLEVLQEEGRLLGNTLLLNSSCRLENIDVIFSMEMHGYFDALEEDHSRIQYFLKSKSSELIDESRELTNYFLNVKTLNPTLFYVLSSFLSEPSYKNRMIELEKMLNKQTLGDDWAEKFRLPVNTELLHQWLEKTLHSIQTSNAPQENVELVFETIQRLVPEENMTHLMPIVFSEDAEDIENFVHENVLNSSLIEPIASLVNELRGAESSQLVHNIFKKHYLDRNVKSIENPQPQRVILDSRF